jgi:hypothetical protein
VAAAAADAPTWLRREGGMERLLLGHWRRHAKSWRLCFNDKADESLSGLLRDISTALSAD